MGVRTCGRRLGRARRGRHDRLAGKAPPPCAAHTRRSGKRSSTPPKISRDSATDVSVGLPTWLNMLAMSSRAPSVQPHGWMSTGASSSTAVAQKGSSPGASSSTPAPAVVEICTPTAPRSSTACRSWVAARSGRWVVTVATGSSLSGACAQCSATAWLTWATCFCASVSSSQCRVDGIGATVCTSTPPASIARSRIETSVKLGSNAGMCSRLYVEVRAPIVAPSSAS